MFLLLERPGNPSSTWGREASIASPPPTPRTRSHAPFLWQLQARAPKQCSEASCAGLSGWRGRQGGRRPAARPGRGGAWASCLFCSLQALSWGDRRTLGNSSPGPWLHHCTNPAECQAHHPRQEVAVIGILCCGHRAGTTAGPARSRHSGLSRRVGVKLQPLQGCNCPFSPAPPFQILLGGMQIRLPCHQELFIIVLGEK